MRIPKDYQVNKKLIENCKSVGLIHLGKGKFKFKKFTIDLSASDYELKSILKNILDKVENFS